MLSNTSNKVIAIYIYYFKHEGYHNVKCISKELRYRDNRGTRGRRYFTDFLPTWSTYRLERGWYLTTYTTKGLPYSLVNLTPTGSIHASTIGALVGGNRNLSQGWGTYPQLNWRLPTNATKGHNATKATKPSRVPRTQEGQAPMSNSNQILRGEPKPMQQMQMARTTQRCSNPSLSSSNKATKAIGEQERRNQRETQNAPKSRSPKMHSQRDESVRSKRGSRSPLSSTQIWARIIRRKRLGKLQDLEQVWTKLSLIEEEEAIPKLKTGKGLNRRPRKSGRWGYFSVR